MKKYYQDLDVQNLEKVQAKIEEWKKDILKEVRQKSKNIIAYFIISIFLLLAGIGFFLGFVIELAEADQGFLFIILAIIALISFALSGLCLFLGIRNRKRALTDAIATKNINPYTHWLPEINENIIIREPLKEKKSRFEDYSQLKYVMSGKESLGLAREYELSNGIIFDNPYTLSCGIWESRTLTSPIKQTYRKYFDYLPLIKVKTNLFSGKSFSITNAKDFGNFIKKDIKVENDEFNKKFSISASDENAVRMILTPLIQNKWLDIKNLKPFNMNIKNGYINVLLKPKSSFMDESLIKNKTFKNFDKIDKLIWNDISDFLNVMTLIFSISIFQFEENNKSDKQNIKH